MPTPKIICNTIEGSRAIKSISGIRRYYLEHLANKPKLKEKHTQNINRDDGMKANKVLKTLLINKYQTGTMPGKAATNNSITTLTVHTN